MKTLNYPGLTEKKFTLQTLIAEYSESKEWEREKEKDWEKIHNFSPFYLLIWIMLAYDLNVE